MIYSNLTPLSLTVTATVTVTVTDPVTRLGRRGAAPMNVAQVGSSPGGCVLVSYLLT